MLTYIKVCITFMYTERFTTVVKNVICVSYNLFEPLQETAKRFPNYERNAKLLNGNNTLN